jgi:uncharacterized protein YaiI (UPF0178 family)
MRYDVSMNSRRTTPTIWVDADACPKLVKEILFRAAQRSGIQTTLVANKMLFVPPSPHLRAVQVPSGFDVADKYIVQQLQPGDLAITADIPLAAEVVGRGCLALSPRGELFTSENIGGLLDMRNFLSSLRDQGVNSGGPAAIDQGDLQAFAGQLDRWLAKLPRPQILTPLEKPS